MILFVCSHCKRMVESGQCEGAPDDPHPATPTDPVVMDA